MSLDPAFISLDQRLKLKTLRHDAVSAWASPTLQRTVARLAMVALALVFRHPGCDQPRPESDGVATRAGRR